MDTDIRYLELVHGDLTDAARRVTERRRAPRRSLRPFVAAAAATLAVAGVIGWWVTTGGTSRFTAHNASSPASANAGSTGPTGATAGGVPNIRRQFDLLSPLPSLAPGYASGVAIGVEPPGGELSRIIRTARIGLLIPRDAFDDRFAKASEIADANGGYVQTSTTRERSGNLTVRVPASNFDETLRALRELGDVDVQAIEGRDVTADYVDLNARLRIAKARRDVLLRLMDQATTIEQTIRVQNALDDTQLRIEEMQGQLNVLDNRTSLATVQVDLREQGVQRVGVEKASIPNAFERSVAGFVGVIAGIVVGLGYLLPLILIALAGWFVVVRVRRRRLA